jgi:hypothetical protein
LFVAQRSWKLRDNYDNLAVSGRLETMWNPSDFIAIDPSDPTKRIVAKGAHQLGLQSSPLKYFWTVSLAIAQHD